MGFVLHQHGHGHGHNHSHSSKDDYEARGEDESHYHGGKIAVLCYVVGIETETCAHCSWAEVRATRDGSKRV